MALPHEMHYQCSENGKLDPVNYSLEMSKANVISQRAMTDA